jgi:hypothetical protein
VDIAAATQEADEAFSRFKRADQRAQRAERDVAVRIGGGWGKVSTLKDREVLTVSDWQKAITDMSGDDGSIPGNIAEAILTAARAWRKALGSLPAGIQQSYDRRI